jgi:dihydropteroate synthase
MTKPYDPFAPFGWKLAHDRSLTLGPAGRIIGVINVTPDSFSDGGQFLESGNAVEQAKSLFNDGAVMIDVGGESSRPGAEEISGEEECRRILPVIEQLAQIPDMLISVDTWRASTAEKALAAGAHVINDIWGFQRDPELAPLAAEKKAGSILMHTGRGREKLPDPVEDQMFFLSKSIERASDAGIEAARIVLDPGFGFAKDASENVTILANLEKLFELGQPILTGTSRKRFIGEITGRPAEERDVGTSATTVVARMKGSAIFRVHDVATNMDALKIAEAVLSSHAR